MCAVPHIGKKKSLEKYIQSSMPILILALEELVPIPVLDQRDHPSRALRCAAVVFAVFWGGFLVLFFGVILVGGGVVGEDEGWNLPCL